MGPSAEVAANIMSRYENQISLIDATYRTMRYELLVCTRTNVGYSIIAQSESAKCISEEL